MKTTRTQTIIDTAKQLEHIALTHGCWELAGRAKAIHLTALAASLTQNTDKKKGSKGAC